MRGIGQKKLLIHREKTLPEIHITLSNSIIRHNITDKILGSEYIENSGMTSQTQQYLVHFQGTFWFLTHLH